MLKCDFSSKQVDPCQDLFYACFYFNVLIRKVYLQYELVFYILCMDDYSNYNYYFSKGGFFSISLNLDWKIVRYQRHHSWIPCLKGNIGCSLQYTQPWILALHFLFIFTHSHRDTHFLDD